MTSDGGSSGSIHASGGSEAGGAGAGGGTIGPGGAIGSSGVDSGAGNRDVGLDAALDIPEFDTPVLDAPGTCSMDRDCPAQSPLCLGNRCAKCAGDSDCVGRAGPACAASGVCVACTGNKHCTGAAATCDTTTSQCVGCTKRGDCSGTCQTCASGVCTALKSQDDPGVCAGTCDATGACKKKRGQTCQAATDCADVSSCADGICCDKPCTGSCEACNLTTSPGTCTTLAPNAQPAVNHTACVTVDSTCAGKCNGSPDCSYPPPTTACGTAACSSGTYQAAGMCNYGTCALPAAKLCANLCVATAGGCVECTTSSQCADPTKPICQQNACVSCAAASSAACGAKDSSKTTCDSGTGKCVECTSSNQCTTAVKPICGNAQTCVSCGDASAPTNGCFTKNGSLAACNPTIGSCVECVANSHCTTSTKPVCNTSTNQCVQCVADTQCSGATPICSSVQTCVACTTDAQCVSKLGQNPGVCMFHQDGRCATDAEAIYAESTVGCASTLASGGTAATPYCTADLAVSAVAATRRLIVVRGTVGSGMSWFTSGAQLTVVGQLNGTLFPTNVIPNCAEVSNGADLYIRDLICNTNYNTDAIAAHSATLHLLRMVLFDSTGGLLLDSSNFEIVDTIFSNNSGYGISVNNPPATGLKRIERVTFKDINAADITCNGPIVGVGVYSPDNRGISTACGITACTPASASCGSSLTWISPN